MFDVVSLVYLVINTAGVALGIVEHFSYVGSTITNDAKCEREIKYTIDMAKAIFNKNNVFPSPADWT